MAWKPDYATVDELQVFVGIPTADTLDDAALGSAITAASRAIDSWCSRQFGVLSVAAARYYGWDGRYLEGRAALRVDDLQTVTSLAVTVAAGTEAVFSTTLTSGTDFDLWPFNAAADGEPWTHLVLRPAAATTWPCRARSVSITGLWGWTAVPAVVKEAVLIQSARWFKRKDAPFGISGSPDMGGELRLLDKLDPDVAVLLGSVRRMWGAAG
jgi:hypothetical protein